MKSATTARTNKTGKAAAINVGAQPSFGALVVAVSCRDQQVHD